MTTPHDSRTAHGRVAVAVSIAAIAAAPCWATAAVPTGNPSADPVPALDYDTTARAFVVHLHFAGATSATAQSVEIAVGPAAGNLGEARMLTNRVYALGGSLLDSFHATHPLLVRTYDSSGLDHASMLPQGDGEIVFPFRSDAATLDVSDVATSASLVSVDLVAAIHGFCRSNRERPDCATAANRSPTCDAGGPYAVECAGPATTVTLDGQGSSDADGDPLWYAWAGPFVGGAANGVNPEVQFPGYATFPVSLTVSDDFGGTAACTSQVTVDDTVPPAIACNSPSTMRPSGAPNSFVASASDACVGNVGAVITGYDCFAFTPKGKRVDKKESCKVNVSHDTITIVDSGGVGDHITWNVSAVDTSGNRSTAGCEVVVVR